VKHLEGGLNKKYGLNSKVGLNKLLTSVKRMLVISPVSQLGVHPYPPNIVTRKINCVNFLGSGSKKL